MAFAEHMGQAEGSITAFPQEYMQVRAYFSSWDFGIQMAVRAKHPDGSIYAAEPLMLRKVEPGPIQEPTLSISENAAQSLMDDLWNLGIRPKEADSPGELRATRFHLDDMRKIAFSKIKVSQ